MDSTVCPRLFHNPSRSPPQPAKMAYHFLDNDCDSTFGEDFSLWDDYMFSPTSAPLAGTKRDADNIIINPKTIGSGLPADREHQVEQTDPRTVCCSTCCPEQASVAVADGPPSKRRASAQKVAEFHNTAGGPSTLTLNTDLQFPEICWEEFCQTHSACTSSPCALPCPGDAECSQEDACWDPHCDQGQQCSDQCNDPECSKSSCSNDTCFSQKCAAQPCPLGDPSNDCHLAHSAPDTSGTIYCYDNAPCHFQNGHHFSHSNLPTYEGYQCFSQSHGSLEHCNVTAQPSNISTPVLSSSAYTPLHSTFSPQSSPTPGPGPSTNCFLNIPFDHCHLDPNTCCHGSTRAHGDFSTASQDQFEIWKLSLGSTNDLSGSNGYTMMDFGMQSNQSASTLSFTLPSSAANTATLSSDLSTNMLGFDNSSWMLPDAPFSTAFPVSDSDPNNKLDYLASALQEDTLKQDLLKTEDDASLFDTRPMTSTSSDSCAACVCRWQLGPNMLCLQTFESPEALHKHIKAYHVDNCTRCYCQWEGCDASGKDFKQRSKLSRHLLGHAGYRPYACSFEGCNKTFATNQAKDNHERTHTGDRPYVCDRCGYTTTTHTQLQTHISALHLNQKPHKCRFCEFTCADSSNLSKHERTHQVCFSLLRPLRHFFDY